MADVRQTAREALHDSSRWRWQFWKAADMQVADASLGLDAIAQEAPDVVDLVRTVAAQASGDVDRLAVLRAGLTCVAEGQGDLRVVAREIVQPVEFSRRAAAGAALQFVQQRCPEPRVLGVASMCAGGASALWGVGALTSDRPWDARGLAQAALSAATNGASNDLGRAALQQAAALAQPHPIAPALATIASLPPGRESEDAAWHVLADIKSWDLPATSPDMAAFTLDIVTAPWLPSPFVRMDVAVPLIDALEQMGGQGPDKVFVPGRVALLRQELDALSDDEAKCAAVLTCMRDIRDTNETQRAWIAAAQPTLPGGTVQAHDDAVTVNGIRIDRRQS